MAKKTKKTKKTDERLFTIPVTWMLYGKYEVMATSLEEAVDIVNIGVEPYDLLPEEGEYVDDSLEVYTDTLKEFNPKD